MTTAHTFADELARLDAVATADAVRRKEVSAEEVVAAAIARRAPWGACPPSSRT